MLVRCKCVVCNSSGLNYLDNIRAVSARRNTFLDLLDAASSMQGKEITQRGTLQGHRSSTRELLTPTKFSQS